MSLVFEEHKILIPQPQKAKIPSPSKKKKVIVIAGPTAVGKTEISLRVAEGLGGEIISADSVQVYRGMDIGTAKVSPEVRLKTPHYLIDIRNLNEDFNVMDFYTEACKAIKEILDRGHVPIVVGGTGFYLHALLYGPPGGPPSIPSVRAQLESEMQEKGPLTLYQKLSQLDPDYAKTITQHDRHKIIRGLEIIALTQQKVSQFSKLSVTETESYDYRCWFIYLPKEKLYPRIEARCDRMLAEHFVEEVKKLDGEGLRQNRTAAQAIGYRQCLEYLQTAQTEDDRQRFIAAFKQASRRYAKRQFTWFRKEPLFRWLNTETLAPPSTTELIIQDYEQSF